MAQLMPLPLTVSCFSKIQIGFTFLAPAHLGSPGKRAVKWVCVFTNRYHLVILAAAAAVCFYWVDVARVRNRHVNLQKINSN